jgi:hypothetical protein
MEVAGFRTRRSLIKRAAGGAALGIGGTGIVGAGTATAAVACDPTTFLVEDFQTGAGDRAAAQAAIDAAVAAAQASNGPATVAFLGSKSYAFNDGEALRLPRQFSGSRLRITGEGCRVRLSHGCPRMFDFARAANYDVFQRFDIENFVIDAGNVGGYGHVLIGTIPPNGGQMRLNVRDIAVRNIQLLNVSTATTNASRKCIWITGVHDAPGEPRTELRDLVFEDLLLDGGRSGIVIAGEFANPQSYDDGLDVYMDGIVIRRCEHTLRVPAAIGRFSANFQVGGSGYGGTCHISDCRGSYSSDVGVEVNALDRIVVERTEIIDPWRIGFTQNNIRSPLSPETQSYVARDCTVRRKALSRVKGFGSGGTQNNVPPSHLVYDNCGFESTAAEPAGTGHPMFSFLSAPRSITIRDCTSDVHGYDKKTTGTAAQTDGIYFAPIEGGTTPLNIRGLRLINQGRVSAGTVQWRGVAAKGGNLVLDVDGLEVDVEIAGVQRRGVRAVELSWGTVSGVIENLRVARVVGDSGAIGVYIDAPPGVTIGDSLRVVHSDFSGLPSGGTDVFFVSSESKPRVFFEGNRWRIFPRPAVTLTATASPFTYRNLQGYAITLNVAGGGVTAIELSRDGQQWADTGLKSGQVRVEAADYVRITYTGAAPALKFLPAP